MCEQYSEEWWQIRRGKPSASNFGRILTPAKMQPSAQQEDYIAELAAEVFAMPYIAPFTRRDYGEDMAEGIRREPESRRWYSMIREVDVQQVGGCETDDEKLWCSPDGLVGADGGLELKNPAPRTHVKYLQAGGVPAEYLCQVHGSLIITGRKWWDFASYSPGLPPLLVRVTPDKFTARLCSELESFKAKYAAWLDRLRAM